MGADRPAPALHQLGAENLWGRRGVIKIVACGFPLAVALAHTTSIEQAAGTGVELLALLVALFGWSQACILANDLADRRADAAAGKPRWIQAVPPWSGALLVAVVLAGAATLVAALGNGLALGIFAAAAVIGVAYSAPPRLKERGALGPASYALATALAFGALPWAWLGAPPAILLCALLAVAADKWVNLHFHQLVDHRADLDAGVRTLATRHGPERTRRALRLTALVTTFLLLWVAGALDLSRPDWTPLPLPAALVVGLAVGVYSALRRRRSEDASDLVRELPAAYLGATLAILRIYPALLLGELALRTPALWPAATVFGAIVVWEGILSLTYRRP